MSVSQQKCVFQERFDDGHESKLVTRRPGRKRRGGNGLTPQQKEVFEICMVQCSSMFKQSPLKVYKALPETLEEVLETCAN